MNPMAMPNLSGFPGEGAGQPRNVFSGPINTAVPGRTDRHHMNVKNGSYVIPAEVVSGIGQGNTAAGHNAINALFPKTKLHAGHAPKMGGVPHQAKAMMHQMHMPRMAMPSAHGGAAEDDPEHPEIVAAGGEHVLTPEQVIARYGDLEKGHDILDKLMVMLHEQHIKDLKKYPGPKK